MKHERRKQPEHRLGAVFALCPMSRKVCWDSKRAAKLQAKRLTREVRKQYTPYICGTCNYWHLTSQRQRKGTNDE